MPKTYHGGPVVKIAKESIGFDVRAYRENPFTDDDARYLRRFRVSVHEELLRATRRRERFRFYRPELE